MFSDYPDKQGERISSGLLSTVKENRKSDFRRFLKAVMNFRLLEFLSAMLNLSRTTVTQAYKRLLEEGWIFSEKGRGCFVSECAIDLDLHKSSIATLSNNIKNPNYQLKLKLQNRLYSFQYKKEVPFALIALRLTWKASRERLDNNRGKSFKKPWMHNAYAEPGGYRPFKKVIADLLRRSRGINCSGSQVIITSGVQEDLLFSFLQALFSEGAKIAVEDPGFRPHRDLVEFLGHRLFLFRQTRMVSVSISFLAIKSWML